MFRKYKGIKLSEVEQGLIYFKCLNFKHLSKSEQNRICELTDKCGGEYRAALFDLITTRRTAISISQQYFISTTALYKARNKFYMSYYKK